MSVAVSESTAKVERSTFVALSTQHPPVPHANPEVTGCQVSAAWFKGLAGGCPKFGSWAKNPQFHLVPSRATTVTVELRQQMGEEGKGFGIGFIVLKAEDATAPKLTVTKPEMVYYTKPYKSSQRVSATLTLPPRPGGLPYIVIPSTYEPNQLAQFTLSIETDDPKCEFGWLGAASRVFPGSRAPALAAEVGGATGGSHAERAGHGGEVRMGARGKGLSQRQEQELERLVADALGWCAANGGKAFEDSAFPAEPRSVWGSDTPTDGLPAPAVWLRPSELPAVKAAGKQPVLFRPRAEVDGVVSGPHPLRNEWLLAACNVAAGSRDVVDRLFAFPPKPATQPQPQGAAARGFYVLAFHTADPRSDDECELVLVDDRLPCDEAGEPLFARGSSAEVVWAMIVEKAFAKLSGGYARTAGGTVRQGLELLTGGVPSKLDLTDPATVASLTGGASEAAGANMDEAGVRERLLGSTAGLWAALLAALKGSPPQLVGCAYKPRAKPGKLPPNRAQEGANRASGLVIGAVYCVSGGIEYDGTRLLRLRQLHGQPEEWNGRWSDGSSLWTANMRQMLNYANDTTDGTFWMCVEDFAACFDRVYLCDVGGSEEGTRLAVSSQWRGASAGGGPQHLSFRHNGQWLLEVSRRTAITVSVSTEDPRRAAGRGGKDGLRARIGWAIYRGNERPADRRRRRLVVDDATERVAACEPSLCLHAVRTVTLDPSAVPYVLVPHTDKPSVEAPFRLTLSAREAERDGVAPFSLQPVRAPTDWKLTALRGQWGGEQPAGGPPGSGSSFWANGQYELILEKRSRVFVFLEPGTAVAEGGAPSAPSPACGFELREGTGRFCRLHEQASGRRLEQSAVREGGAGVWLDKVLDANGGRPYVLIPFSTAQRGISQPFTISVYTDNKHTFGPVGARPECPICERMAVVLARLAEHEAQVDERLAYLEQHSYLLEHACRRCGTQATVQHA